MNFFLLESIIKWIDLTIFYYGWIPGIEPGLTTPQVTVLPLNYIHQRVKLY